MLIQEITEARVSVTSIADRIVRTHESLSTSDCDINWLYKIAEDERVRFLLGQYIEANQGRKPFPKDLVYIRTKLYTKALNLMDHYRHMRQLATQTQRNLQSAGF